MDILELIKNRRSIRQYQPTPINDKDLATILEAARWAPSWKNSQCTRFIIVKDSQLKTQLADTLSPNNPSNAAIKQAPLAIVACAELKKSGYGRSGQAETDKGDYWYMFDVALAMQNLVLTACSLGLSTVYVGLFDAAGAAKLLNVPEGFVVVAIIPLGYAAAESRAPQRKELSETVFYESWGKPRG
jgi:nitroreductase